MDDNREVNESRYESYRGVKEEHITLWVYTQKYSTIASGATTIESAERAPDNIIIQSFDLMTKSRYNIFEPILETIHFRL
jgi:hypothetical protein